jgi:RHS repeat-associated protein
MNSLRTLDPFHGYWIRMNAPANLSVGGTLVAVTTPISLRPGWNLIGYLPEGPEPITTALAGITGQYSAVTGYQNGALYYYPALPPAMSNLRTMDLNLGYWINMSSARTLIYPAAAQTATPVPTATPLLALPGTPTPLPTPQPTPTLGPRLTPINPPAVISANTTWRPSDGVYVVNSTVTVNQGILLTIEPGTVVKFYNDSWTSVGLIINGSLVADGTSAAPIVFTSLLDDSYGGDTNSDGTMSTPGVSDWSGITFNATSTGSRLKYARISYAGTLLAISGSSPLVENCTLEYASSTGLSLTNSAAPVVRGSRVAHISGNAVNITTSSAPNLQNNVFDSNGGYAINMEANTAPRFSGNRAFSNGTNGIGVSGTIAPSVTWDSDLPYVLNGITVNAGITLGLLPGAVIKFASGTALTINGRLNAPGTAANPIIFTSLKDDSAGGDTNNDGSASRPAPGDWSRIAFSNSSVNSLLDYVVVRYGGSGGNGSISVDGSAPTIRNSQIVRGSSYGIRLTNVAMPSITDSLIADNNSDGIHMTTSSAPALTNNGFVNNTGYAVRMDASCAPTMGGSSASNNIYNGVGVNGAVPANTTWPVDLPYVIDGGMTVNTGVVLTLPAGSVVKFRSGNLVVNGTLRANGTDGSRIVFTSFSDTSAAAAGSILGRASAASLEAIAAPGDWGRIEFASTSSASTLSYVVVRYGGSGSYGSVYLNGAAPSINNTIISDSSGHGLYIAGASPIIMGNTFTANGNAGIYATNLANPTIQNNLIYGNAQYGVNNASAGVTIDATNNWWGNASGPVHTSNPSGTGDQVSNGVTFNPWLGAPARPTPTPYPTPTATPVINYVGGTISAHTTWTTANSPYVVNNDVTVNNGVILSIQPGVVVKFQNGRRLTVNGVLAASGASANPIIFTSFLDDTYAGDTNGDGGATRPAAGAWGGITLAATASASNLTNVLMRYAGISVSGSSPSISNSTVMQASGAGISVSNAGAPNLQLNTVRDNGGAGISLSGSSPTIQNSVFVNNGGAAITMDGNSLPDNAGNRAYYNDYNGIQVSGTAGTRGSWHADLPYIINGGLIVGTGVVLTAPAGTIVKFTSGSLTVNGGLVANGTAAKRIVFTSIHDDSVGGDTNNNGAESRPLPGNWSAIAFTASSLSSTSLTYSDVLYGGVKVTSASPTIANNVIAYAGGYGLQVETLAAPTIRDNVIRDNRNTGLYMTGSSAPAVENNQFTGNLGHAAYMSANCTPTFIGNTATNNRTNGVGVSGNVSATTTWLANLTYVIEGVTIDAGVTLTLEPGVVVKLTANASMTANGNLVAVGASGNKITFTSLKDDSLDGDTNNDGSATVPTAGDWTSIQFNSSSSASRFDQVIVKYGGSCRYNCYSSLYLNGVAFLIQNTTLSQSYYYGLQVKNANPTVSNVEISNSRYGIYLESAHPTISNSTIRDNTNYGIYGTGSNPTITGSTISNNNRGIYLFSTSAPYPSISGNTFANNQTYAASIEIGALPAFGANSFVGEVGNGIQVGGGTLTQNATLYGTGVYIIGKTIVEQSASLTIQPGAIIKAYNDWKYGCGNICYGILIKGSLTANGEETNPIVFTSGADDAHGGDTNGDGSGSGPASRDWAGIHFGPTSSTSTIQHATIKYAGQSIYDGANSFSGGVSINNASPTIQNSTLQNNGTYGIYLTGASPTIAGNTLAAQSYAIHAVSLSYPSIAGNNISSTTYGIYLDDASSANISGNTFATNPTAIYLKADTLPAVGPNTAVTSTGNGISVRSGAIASNTTIYPGTTYVLDRVTVNAGVALTVQPGAVTKFSYDSYNGWSGHLLVRGRLAAQGSQSQKIVFTSERDDTYGGDTNNDGANSTPRPGIWRGIYLSTSDSNLDYVVIKYGGGGMNVDGTDYNAALILNNVSPTVSHSTIARNSNYGIYVKDATPSIHDNDIWGNSYGIYSTSGARPAIHNNTIRDNSSYGVYNADNTLVVDATNNSWGHDSGPKPVGAGNGVNYADSSGVRTYRVAFDPWNGKTHWIEQNLGVLRRWIAYAADPVNTATGNYVYNYEDVRIPGRGLSLSFQRFYNSFSTYQGPLGYGWTFNYGMNVREEDGNALVMVEDGRIDKYAPDGSGGYTPPQGGHDILTKSGGTFHLLRKDQTRYNFDSAGKLATIVDRNSNTVTLGYSGGRLVTVTDPTGRQLTLTYDGSNRIAQVSDPAGRIIRFAHDEFSNLISVIDARNNTTRYAYDSKHRLLTITDPNDHIFVTNIYDAAGRVITQRDARLKNTTFSYNTTSKVTTVTDPRNYATTYTYDAELRLQSERDAAGYTTSYGYDSDNNRTHVTDRRGNSTQYGYDGMANTVAITDTLSGVTQMTYDGMNNLTSQTDPLGRTTAYAYDAKGNLTSTTDALGGGTSFAYNAFGLMTSTTNARNFTTAFGYDAHGYQVSATDPLNHTATTVYDIAGRKLSETDALNRTTTYTYDANNHLLTVTNALGGVIAYTYDAVGNRLTVTDPLGRVTRYTYDQKDKPLTVTDPLNGLTRYEYDANDNKIKETDPLTHTTTFTYDRLNRLTQVSNPLGKTTGYGYDVDGNRTSVTDANGKTTNFTFDGLNRLTRVTDPLLNSTSYVYDAVGNKLRVIDANGNITFYEYDKLDRLVKVTDALNGVVQYEYDQAGNKTRMTDANNHVTTYDYDALNRLIRTTDPLTKQVQYGYDAVGNRTTLTNARSQATTYSYDKLNRLTGVMYPGSTIAYGYDKVGNRATMTDTTGTTAYAYDALNRVTSVTNPGSRVVGYSYDAAGNRTRVTYPDGKAVDYLYDAANRMTRATDWSGKQTNYTYDNVGNPTGQTNPNNTSISRTYDASNRLTGVINTSTVSGTIASFSYTLDKVGNRTKVVDTEGTTTYEYDKLYRLTYVSYPDAKSTIYSYDPMGNRLAMTTTLGVTDYTYDAADRLLTAGATAFTWDADGNMLTKGSQAFTYDAINRLTQVVSGTLTVGYAYEGDGRRASKTVNGAKTNYTYDTIAGLAYVLTETTGGDTSLYTYGTDLIADTNPAGVQSYYHTDGLGSTRGLTSGSGQVTARYTYDAFGATRSSSGTGSTTFKFAGEQMDGETGLIYLRARYYDPGTGRFLTKDPIPGLAEFSQTINPYVYVGNNPVNLTDPKGELAPLVAAGLFGLAGMLVGGITYAVTTPREDWNLGKFAAVTVGTGLVFAVAPFVIAGGLAAGPAAGTVMVGVGGLSVSTGTAATIAAGTAGFGYGIDKYLAYKAIDKQAPKVGEAVFEGAWESAFAAIGAGTPAKPGVKWFLKELVKSIGSESLKNLISPPEVLAPTTNNGASPWKPGPPIDDQIGGGGGSPYVRLVDILQKSGFDVANPQPPPSGSK